MSSFDPAPESSRKETPAAPEPHRTEQHGTGPHGTGSHQTGPRGTGQHGPLTSPADSTARVGTIVWGLVVLALAILIIISQLGLVVLNGTYVLIGLMIGAGAALVIGGLLSARRRDNGTTNGKA
jgi:hypothetical protein